MKGWLVRLQTGVVLLSMSGSVFAEKDQEIPVPLLNAGMAYQKKGAAQFLPALIKGSRLQFTDDVSLSQANDMLRAIEDNYGHYIGIELICAIPVSESTRVVYFVINYERGPLYGVADLYKTEQGEIVTNTNVNTEWNQIMSPEILAKKR